MTEQELLSELWRVIEAQGWSQNQLARKAGLSVDAIRGIRKGRGLTLWTLTKVATVIGFKLELVPMHPAAHYEPYTPPGILGPRKPKEKPAPEYACLKCGQDAGVVTVAGHDQCAHCGHIIQDCCGD